MRIKKICTIHKIWLSVIFTLLTSVSFSQGGAAINTTGAAADPSAIIDASSTTQGLLIPRMTTAERNAIINPAEGLQIFNITTKCFEYFAYNVWQTWHCAVCPLPAAAGIISGSAAACPGDNNVSYSVPAVANATSYIWAYSGTGVTVNGTTNSITIDFSGTATSGNLSVMGTNMCGDGTASADFAITLSSIPASPASGTHTLSETEIIWNWNTVSGAAGYKYNTINDYASAIDNGTNTSYTQTGLTCGTAYTLYVWAYNTCGYSSAITLNATTSLCTSNACGIITFTYRGSSVTYGTVNGQNSTCWLDRNLGALQVATSFDDINAYGDLFQWGRLDDGHQDRNSTTTTTLSGSAVPGHSNWISNITYPSDWINPQNTNLWQVVSGINNPCPSGWRLPTSTEFDNERLSWSSQDHLGAFASPMKLTMGGDRGSSGVIGAINAGSYWTSTTESIGSRILYFFNGWAGTTTRDRGYGMSVRCIKN